MGVTLDSPLFSHIFSHHVLLNIPIFKKSFNFFSIPTFFFLTLEKLQSSLTWIIFSFFFFFLSLFFLLLFFFFCFCSIFAIAAELCFLCSILTPCQIILHTVSKKFSQTSYHLNLSVAFNLLGMKM